MKQFLGKELKGKNLNYIKYEFGDKIDFFCEINSQAELEFTKELTLVLAEISGFEKKRLEVI